MLHLDLAFRFKMLHFHLAFILKEQKIRESPYSCKCDLKVKNQPKPITPIF